MKTIILGGTYRDVITGFTGVAIGHCEYLTGCNQTLITPKINADGAAKDSNWYDDQRLEICEDKIIKLDNGKTPGFADSPPSRK